MGDRRGRRRGRPGGRSRASSPGPAFANAIRVLAVDAHVHAVRRVSRAAQVPLAGGGGTDMGRGIDAAAALRPRPSVIVVLTDGFTPWPEYQPKGTRVVVGLLAEGPHQTHRPPPAWAHTILIEPAGERPGHVRNP